MTDTTKESEIDQLDVEEPEGNKEEGRNCEENPLISDQTVKLIPGLYAFEDLLELYAIGDPSQRIWCPFCKKEKSPEALMCDSCGQENFPMKEGVLSWELARRNPGILKDQGSFLSPRQQKTLLSHALQLLKPPLGKQLCQKPERLIKILKVLTEAEHQKYPVHRIFLIKIAYEAIALTLEKDKQQAAAKSDTAALGQSEQDADLEKVERPESFGSKTEAGVIAEKPAISGESAEITYAQGGAVPTKEVQLPEGKIEIIPGFWLYDDIIEKMASEYPWKGTQCPICRRTKLTRDRVCSSCIENHFGMSKQLIDWELARRVPHRFPNVTFLSPRKQEWLLDEALAMIRGSEERDYYRAPNELIGTLNRIAESIFYYKEHPVAMFIIVKIAYEALAIIAQEEGFPGVLEEEATVTKAKIVSLPTKSAEASAVQDNEPSFGQAPKKKAVLIKSSAADKEKGKDAADQAIDAVDSVDSKDFEAMVKKRLAKIKSNLREDPELAKAFAFYLDGKFVQEKEQGRFKLKKEEFRQEIGLPQRSWAALRRGEKKYGLAKSTAEEVAGHFDLSLEELLVKGLEILDQKDQDSSGFKDGNKKAQASKLPDNLRKDPRIAKAFALYLDKRYEEERAKSKAAGDTLTKDDFRQKIGMPQHTWDSLRRGDKDRGLLREKAAEVAGNLGLSLEELLRQGLEILSQKDKEQSEKPTSVVSVEVTDSGKGGDADTAKTLKSEQDQLTQGSETDKEGQQISSVETVKGEQFTNLNQDSKSAAAFLAYFDREYEKAKEKRKAEGGKLSKKAFEKETGMPKLAWAALRRDSKDRGLGRKTAEKIADYFGLSLEDLLVKGLELLHKKEQKQQRMKQETEVTAPQESATQTDQSPTIVAAKPLDGKQEGEGFEIQVKNLKEINGAPEAFTEWLRLQEKEWTEEKRADGRNVGTADFCKFIGVAIAQYKLRMEKPERPIETGIARKIADKLDFSLEKAIEEGEIALTANSIME